MRLTSFILMLYFSLLSLAPNWQGIQLLNASAFIDHYEDYQRESRNGNIFTFIHEHYFNHIQDFDKAHEKLPLKTSVQVATIYFTEKFDVPTPVVHSNDEVYGEHLRNFSKECTFIPNDFQSIWHPPQLG